MVLLAVGACHTGYDPNWERTISPSGRRAYVLECGRTAWCVTLAGELCPSGYTVLSTGSDAKREPGQWPDDATRTVRYATVECKSQDSPSLPPRITVTKNAPPVLPQKASSYSSGLEDEPLTK
jgi:hypothetical protein